MLTNLSSTNCILNRWDLSNIPADEQFHNDKLSDDNSIIADEYQNKHKIG